MSALGGTRVAAILLVLVGVSGRPAVVAAQPEPSFRASCGALRASIETLDTTDEALVTIQIVGPLTGAEFDGALAYLTMCAAPDPQVLCIAYSTRGLEVGDLVALSGNFSPQGPDHVLLDPCLPSLP